MMIRLFIADDHEMVREGLRRIISQHPDMSVVGEAGSGQDLLVALRETPADVLLLDIAMPGPGFLETMRRLTANHPQLRILVLSMHPEDHYAVRALRAGAAGYVTKERSGEELASAIRRVHRGGRYVSAALAEYLAGELRPSEGRPPHELLSDREYEIFRMLGSGLAVKEIAEQLALSPKTVSTYRARIIEKTHLRSNAEIIRYVVENGLAQ